MKDTPERRQQVAAIFGHMPGSCWEDRDGNSYVCSICFDYMRHLAYHDCKACRPAGCKLCESELVSA